MYPLNILSIPRDLLFEISRNLVDGQGNLFYRLFRASCNSIREQLPLDPEHQGTPSRTGPKVLSMVTAFRSNEAFCEMLYPGYTRLAGFLVSTTMRHPAALCALAAPGDWDNPHYHILRTVERTTATLSEFSLHQCPTWAHELFWAVALTDTDETRKRLHVTVYPVYFPTLSTMQSLIGEVAMSIRSLPGLCEVDIVALHRVMLGFRSRCGIFGSNRKIFENSRRLCVGEPMLDPEELSVWYLRSPLSP